VEREKKDYSLCLQCSTQRKRGAENAVFFCVQREAYSLKLFLVKYLFILFLFAACKTKPTMQNDAVKLHAFRLKPGQDLKQEITSYVQQHKIEAGWIMTCVGSVTQYNLRFANQPEGNKATGHFEIVSLVGTVSINGSHLHMSVSDSTGKTIGGHLLDSNLVYTTAEIVIGEGKQLVFTREKDGTTPWEELQVKPKQ
jgi:predicted DNA-binding protein with PD1-like motif